MPAFLYLFIIVFATAFLIDLFPFQKIAGKILVLSKNAMNTIQQSAVDDSVKQNLLLSFSLSIFKESIKIAALTLVVLAAVYILILLISMFKQVSFRDLMEYSLTLNGLLVALFSFLVYFVLKKIYARLRV